VIGRDDDDEFVLVEELAVIALEVLDPLDDGELQLPAKSRLTTCSEEPLETLILIFG
jgi:hypothetical protein